MSSDVNINYKGSSIATMDDTGTKKLLTSGKYCESDIEVAYTKPTTEPVLVPYAIRPDAELIQSYRYDKYLNADEGIAMPTYSTSAKTLKASWNLEPTVPDVDVDEYRVLLVERYLSIPEYSVETKGKGRVEYQFCAYTHEYGRVDANTIATMLDPTKKITTATSFYGTGGNYRLLYWSSASAIALYNSNGYGVYQTPTAPAISNGVMTVKSPALCARGNTTYFTSTYYNALTDIRYQFAIDVYKVPVDSLNVVGWGLDQILQRLMDDINSEDHTLT